ncbi:hypothetical protein SUGI_0311900 [Cryptomeria japonica]|uniref:uncharacterized protein LOC131054343 n=1 Tax=Cryptomeria japonica TaxID=3369 RepID=UPI0024089599|nr:uncharacterized protein LOC131054343 [Cryptomeria japonica]GLJ17835.1 hypothetical protein SUGI_0311900 [Cryptomeria japonica]
MATQLEKSSDNGGSSGAEVYSGYETCKQKVLELLQELGLPRGLLPLQYIEECGYVRDTGFVWIKRKKKLEYRYKASGVLASYAPEVTCFVEKRKMKKINGVKIRELLVWLPLTELSIQDSNTHMIYCKTGLGVGKSMPIRLWEEEYDKYMSKIDVTPPAET